MHGPADQPADQPDAAERVGSVEPRAGVDPSLAALMPPGSRLARAVVVLVVMLIVALATTVTVGFPNIVSRSSAAVSGPSEGESARPWSYDSFHEIERVGLRFVPLTIDAVDVPDGLDVVAGFSHASASPDGFDTKVVQETSGPLPASVPAGGGMLALHWRLDCPVILDAIRAEPSRWLAQDGEGGFADELVPQPVTLRTTVAGVVRRTVVGGAGEVTLLVTPNVSLTDACGMSPAALGLRAWD